MDAALELKIASERGAPIHEERIIGLLDRSALVKELTSEMPKTRMALVWRLIGMSEIPFGQRLEYTQHLIAKVYEQLATAFGFSLSGDEKMFLPCYNAMIVSALCRLGRANDPEVRVAVDWINANQPMERGKELELKGFNFKRYGGCFQSTPCYIGVAKSIFALHAYGRATASDHCKTKLGQGIQYMLDHRFFMRLSRDSPITAHMLDISFPESYHLNIVELLRFASTADLLGTEAAAPLVDQFKQRRTKDGRWVVNHRFKADGYMAFDKGRDAGDWATYIIGQALRR